MSKAAADDEGEWEEEGYFIPMADLLAGLLFVILILLMSFAIIHYPDPTESVSKEVTPPQPLDDGEIRAIVAKKTTLDLLAEIRSALEANAIPALLDMDNAVIRMPDRAFFEPGYVSLSPGGREKATAAASIMAKYLPCLAARHPVCQSNVGRTEAVAVRVEIVADTGENIAASGVTELRSFATARALALFAALAGHAPGLLELRGAGDGALVQTIGIGEHTARMSHKVAIRVVLPVKKEGDTRSILDFSTQSPR